MSNQRQAPPRNLHLRRMAKEGDRSPGVDFSLPYQFAWNFKHNRRHIALRKEILLMQKCVAIEALFFIESDEECMERKSIAGKQLRSNANIRPHIRFRR